MIETLLTLLSILYVCAGLLASFVVFASAGGAIATLANFAIPGGIPDTISAIIIIVTLSIGVLKTSRVICDTWPAARTRAILEKMRDESPDYNCDW